MKRDEKEFFEAPQWAQRPPSQDMTWYGTRAMEPYDLCAPIRQRPSGRTRRER
jgi:hypothetical protein